MSSKPSVEMMKNVTSKKWFWIDHPDSTTYRQVHCIWFVIWLSLLSTLWQNIYYYISFKSLSSLARNYTVFIERIRNAAATKENMIKDNFSLLEFDGLKTSLKIFIPLEKHNENSSHLWTWNVFMAEQKPNNFINKNTFFN